MVAKMFVKKIINRFIKYKIGFNIFKKSKILNKEDGISIIETMVMSFVFVMLFGFSIGFFGVIQTAIVNTISARAYAFEVFSHRSSLYYFKDHNSKAPGHYYESDVRLHAVQADKTIVSGDLLYATTRYISAVAEDTVKEDNRITMDDKISGISQGARNRDVRVSPVWIKTMYGICLSATCGD